MSNERSLVALNTLAPPIFLSLLLPAAFVLAGFFFGGGGGKRRVVIDSMDFD
jgi:hypothetical protein